MLWVWGGGRRCKGVLFPGLICVMGCGASQDEAGNISENTSMLYGRRRTKVDVETIPSSRKSMVVAELKAHKLTQYRKQFRAYSNRDQLDYSANPGWSELRDVIDEPVGRYYLKLWADDKQVVHVRNWIIAWASIEKLRQGELQTVDEQLTRLSEKTGTTKVEEHSTSKAIEIENAAEESDAFFDALQRLLKRSLSQDGANAVHCSEKEDSPLQRERVKDIVQKIEEQLSSSSPVQSVIQELLEELQSSIFRAMAMTKCWERFKDRSHYKRYMAKWQKTYNAVNHTDFDYMQLLGTVNHFQHAICKDYYWQLIIF